MSRHAQSPNDDTTSRTELPVAQSGQSDAGSPARQPATRRPAVRRVRLTNGLITLSSAAIVAVYAAGYLRTDVAATAMDQSVAATATDRPIGVTPTVSPATTPAITPSLAALIATPSPGATPRIAETPTHEPRRPATATSPPTPAPDPAGAAAVLRDGSYLGTGTSRHGGLEVMVVVQGGKIASAEITSCRTRYPCSRIAALPGQVVRRQAAIVDLVSGATDSAVAYRSAVNAALAKAR